MPKISYRCDARIVFSVLSNRTPNGESLAPACVIGYRNLHPMNSNFLLQHSTTHDKLYSISQLMTGKAQDA